MSEAGEGNLYLAGGDCAPAITDWSALWGATADEYKAFMAKNFSIADGVGTKPQYNLDVGSMLNGDLFPAPDIDLENKCVHSYTVAGHRNQASFGLSRWLHFSSDTKVGRPRSGHWDNQDSLRKWWFKNMEDIVAGYCLNLVYIPPKHHFRYVYVCNVCPIEGLEFDIVLKRTGEVLGTMDGSVADSICVEVPEAAAWSHCYGEIIQLKLKSVPPVDEDDCKPGCGHLDNWCVMASADVFCPSTGK